MRGSHCDRGRMVMPDGHGDRVLPPLTEEQEDGVLASLKDKGVKALRESLQVGVLAF